MERDSMARLAHDNVLDLRVPHDDFEIDLYTQVIRATIAKIENDLFYGSVGAYHGDGVWSFAVIQKGAKPSTLFTDIKSLHGTISVFDKGGRVQVVWELRSDDPDELPVQSNYAEYPPVVSWATEDRR